MVLCIPIYVYTLLNKKYSLKKISLDILKWLSISVIAGFLFYLQLETLKEISYFYTSILAPLQPEESFQGIIGFTDFYNWFLPLKSPKIKNRNSIIVLSLGVLSYLFLVIKFAYDFIKRKVVKQEIIFIFLFALSFYLSLYIELGTITRRFKFNKLILFLIPISFVLSFLYEKKIRIFKKIKVNYLLILIFILVGVWNMSTLYQRYQRARFVSPVRQEDIQAFEWINNNIPKGSYIIPAHIESTHSYILDSSLYMKAFTDSYELFAFVDGKHPKNEVELKNTYLSLKENPNDKDLLNKFTSSGIYYIFSGSHTPWGCGELPCGLFDKYPEVYEVVYDIGGVEIYKIKE